MHPVIKKTLIASNVALSFAAADASAALVADIYGVLDWSTDSANFTMLTPDGYGFGPYTGSLNGTNDVSMAWDGDAYSASSDYTGPGSYSNVTASSTTPFIGHKWTAHDIQVFVPGTYSFDTTLGGGVSEAGFINVTVPTGMLGMHMLFDWNYNQNIDMFVVMASNSIFGSGVGTSAQTSSGSLACHAFIKNCLYDGSAYGAEGKPAGDKTWMLASVDGNDDGIMGIPMMNGGPFTGFNANFNVNFTSVVCDFDCPSPVPVPAAIWLFGSGLFGLLVTARRRKNLII